MSLQHLRLEGFILQLRIFDPPGTRFGLQVGLEDAAALCYLADKLTSPKAK